jgi:hypothetical protein
LLPRKQECAMKLKPIALTDVQLDIIIRSAGSLHLHDRGAYLEKVAEMLNGHEIGDGLVMRAAREAALQFTRSLELEPKRVQSRWDRDCPRFEKASRRAY